MKFARYFIFIYSVMLASLSSAYEAGEYELDMRGVDIREFIDTIAQITNKTIIVDQRVKGEIDVRSHRKLSASELYEIFLVQLGVNGYAVVELGNGLTKVIPSQGAKVEGVAVIDSRPASGSEQVVTRVIQIKNVDVAKLTPVLQPLVDSQTGIITPFPESNVLLLTDKESNINRLVSIISKVDRVDSQSLEIIRLFHASVNDIERTLSQVITNLGKGAEDSKVVISKDTRTNSLLLIGDPITRAYLKDLVNELDINTDNNQNTKVIYLKYANAEDIAPLLLNVVNQFSDAASTSPNQIQPKVSIEAHQQTNAVILSGSISDMKSVESVIQRLDVRRAQVLVEAIIVELSENLSRSLGVQWLSANDSSTSTPAATVNFNNNGAGIIDLASATVTSSNDLSSVINSQQGLLFGPTYPCFPHHRPTRIVPAK